ncbi:hypothetical protein HAHE_06380 [Haloferula helveola]|uniref:Laminin G domain-containing protein n=1 Tax=Haloferula helveola TaxID=490095 RepID=A0ABM7RDA4_9BACT|nr:hypothetical protein HAHE_06380 [Haloferula helveola]
MSEQDPHPTEVTSNSLWRVIGDFENGALSPEEEAELFGILEESPQARSLYLSYFELSALLQIKAETKKEEGTLPMLPGARVQKKVLGYSVLAAAAVIMLFAGIAWLVVFGQPDPRKVPLAASEGSAWSISKAGETADGALEVVEEGCSLTVSSGTLTVDLESGTRFVIQGPAFVRFPKLEEPELEQGWLWADTGDGAEPLRVVTPTMDFVDIGTRFGVRVRDDLQAELHVIEGIVEARFRKDGSRSKVLAGTTGILFEADGRSTTVPLAADPFPGLPALLNSGPTYATTVMGQAPRGYWRLDEKVVGEAANEVEGGTTGMYAGSVDPAAAGVRPASGFDGFAKDNRGAFLPADSDRSLLYSLDSPEGVSPKEGSVSFWFRRNPDIGQAEVLWYAGVNQGRGLGPQEEMHAYLSESGRVQFFMEAGDRDVLLSSSRSSADGQWHHVAASWGPGAVELYVDGKLAARDEESRVRPGKSLSGINVRFGKTGSGFTTLEKNLVQFRGWVDEVALWSRPITGTEVSLQYQAAVGSGSAGR